MVNGSFISLGLPPSRPQEPFAAFNEKIVQTIEKAICTAWQLLAASKRLNLATESEIVITTALQESIIDVLNNNYVEGFVPEIFQQPTRDASVKDFSGDYLEKKPDLAFFISSAQPLSTNKGLFYECKPIGNVGKYLGYSGLQRFCDGRYAWAMPHAGMIGYVQRKKAPLTAEAAIKENVANGALVVESHCDAHVDYYPIWMSVHRRDFKLLNGKAPGPITIRHIWLQS